MVTVRYCVSFATDMLCFAFMFVLLFDVFRNKRVGNKKNNLFLGCLISNMLCLIGHSIACVFSGNVCVIDTSLYDGIGFVVPNIVSFFGTRIGAPTSLIFAYVFILFAAFHLLDDTRDRKNIHKCHFYIVTISIAIAITAALVNIIVPIYGYFDDNNVFIATNYYWIAELQGALVALCAFVLIIKNRRYFSGKELFGYLSLIIFPGIAFFLRILFICILKKYEVVYNFVYAGASLSTFIFYMNTQNDYINQSRIDTLTGLDNVVGFHRDYKELNYLQSAGVIFIDVNNLKVTNDNFGHDAGDKLLINLGKSILDNLNSTITAYRYGGDEFLVVFKNTDKADMYDFIDNWLNSLYEINFKEFNKVNIAYGFAYSSNKVNIDDLINKADKAMYEHKRRKEENYGKKLVQE